MIFMQDVELEHSTKVTLVCTKQAYDYGVDGSPVWEEAENVKFGDNVIELFGVEVELSALPNDLRKAILEEAETYAAEEKWEACE